MLPRINRLSRPGERNFFTIQHRSKVTIRYFSYKLRRLLTPNGLNYLESICILQFELFQVKLPLLYPRTFSVASYIVMPIFRLAPVGLLVANKTTILMYIYSIPIITTSCIPAGTL